MKTSPLILTLDTIVNLFFLFILGTISFLIYFFIPFPEFKWKQGIRLAILLFGLFSYETVIIKLITYYIIKAKNKFAELLNKYPHLMYILIVGILGITYVIINTVLERSWLVFLRDIVMVCLIIIGLPFANKYFTKNKKTIKRQSKIKFE